MLLSQIISQCLQAEGRHLFVWVHVMGWLTRAGTRHEDCRKPVSKLPHKTFAEGFCNTQQETVIDLPWVLSGYIYPFLSSLWSSEVFWTSFPRHIASVIQLWQDCRLPAVSLCEMSAASRGKVKCLEEHATELRNVLRLRHPWVSSCR